jgi:DNA-directed RNA polymerase specialized sigma24 family protein
MIQLIQKRRLIAISFFMTRNPDLGRRFCEDFGSFCVIQWIEGRNINTNIEYLLIDYLRQNHTPRKRKDKKKVLGYDVMRKDMLEFFPATSTLKAQDDISPFEAITSIATNKYLTDKEKEILILSYRWGFSVNEIKKMIGSNTTAVYQDIKNAERKLRVEHREV